MSYQQRSGPVGSGCAVFVVVHASLSMIWSCQLLGIIYIRTAHTLKSLTLLVFRCAQPSSRLFRCGTCSGKPTQSERKQRRQSSCYEENLEKTKRKHQHAKVSQHQHQSERHPNGRSGVLPLKKPAFPHSDCGLKTRLKITSDIATSSSSNSSLAGPKYALRRSGSGGPRRSRPIRQRLRPDRFHHRLQGAIASESATARQDVAAKTRHLGEEKSCKSASAS